MADDADDSQKTEDPSSRKLGRARAKGQVVQSREVASLFMLGTGAGLLMFAGPGLARRLGEALAAFCDPAQFLAPGRIRWEAVGDRISMLAIVLVRPVAAG